MSNPQAANVPLLHRFMGIGASILAIVVIVMTALDRAPLIPTGASTTQLAYLLCGIAVVLGLVALFVLKPRVPERSPGRTVDQFWLDQNVAAQVVRVWFALEGGATLAAIAMLAVGGPIPLVTTGLLIAAYWITGPNVFAKP